MLSTTMKNLVIDILESYAIIGKSIFILAEALMFLGMTNMADLSCVSKYIHELHNFATITRYAMLLKLEKSKYK